MKDMRSLVQGYSGSTHISEQRAEATEQVISLVNNITSRFEGIYQYTGNINQRKTNLYKQELTKALYQVRGEITEDKITKAINFFALNGGSFAPSIPEFMQVVLGKHKDMVKAPEHVWFDSAKALPAHTPEQVQSMGKKGVAQARDVLKRKSS